MQPPSHAAHSNRAVASQPVNTHDRFRGVGFILEDPLGDGVSKLTGFVMERGHGGLIPRAERNRPTPPHEELYALVRPLKMIQRCYRA